MTGSDMGACSGYLLVPYSPRFPCLVFFHYPKRLITHLVFILPLRVNEGYSVEETMFSSRFRILDVSDIEPNLSFCIQQWLYSTPSPLDQMRDHPLRTKR